MAKRYKASDWRARGFWFDSRWRHIFYFEFLGFFFNSCSLHRVLANEFKHNHSPVVYIVLDPRYNKSHEAYACILSQYNFNLCPRHTVPIFVRDIHTINARVTLSQFRLVMDTRGRKFATSGMIVNTSDRSWLHSKSSCVHRLSF